MPLAAALLAFVLAFALALAFAGLAFALVLSKPLLVACAVSNYKNFHFPCQIVRHIFWQFIVIP